MASVVTGRSVYDNIRRFLQFQITVNVVALTLCSIGAITGVGTPLTAVQLIWVCPRTSHLPTSLPSSLSLSTAVRYKLLRVRPSS
jgi:magnesium-transporting ATPase (P-type)